MPHSVLITPAIAIIDGSKPIKGKIIKKGIYEIGSKNAWLKLNP